MYMLNFLTCSIARDDAASSSPIFYGLDHPFQVPVILLHLLGADTQEFIVIPLDILMNRVEDKNVQGVSGDSGNFGVDFFVYTDKIIPAAGT